MIFKIVIGFSNGYKKIWVDTSASANYFYIIIQLKYGKVSTSTLILLGL